MWAVAIPSYRRPQTLQKKTLRFLRDAGIECSRITVFSVADEVEEYKKFFNPDFIPRIVVGEPGIHRQRSFIESYYPPGTRVLCLDDDLDAIKRPFNSELPLTTLFDKCFEVAEREGCRLWGMYPTDHGLSLKNRAVKGLTYVIGVCHGFVAGEKIEYPDPFTEDFTRSIEYYRRGLGVLRFEGMGPTTRYFKEPGGLQCFRTPETQEAQMVAFVERWPGLSKLRKRPGKMTDVRLQRIIEKEIEDPFA